MENSRLKERLDNLFRATSRNNPTYVPILGTPNSGALHYANVTLWDVIDDEEAYHKAITKVLDDVYCDVLLPQGLWMLPNAHKVMGGVQNRIGPDGITVEHVQFSPMSEDEYPALISDPNKFVKGTLLPRRYPFLFSEDRQKAKEAIKAVAKDIEVFYMGSFNGALREIAEEKHGIPTILDGYLCMVNPLDIIFDDLRGFVGTVTDLRKHSAQIMEALDMLYEQRCNNFSEIGFTYPYVPQYPHIPAYLNVKQFEKYYWPYQKDMIENITKNGNKAYFALQGRWAHLLEYFKDVPKDSCILQVDDDDVIEVSKAIGDYQVICGGAKLSQLKLASQKECIDRAKRVIDECAGTGAFIFSTDKYWLCNGDINQNLIDVFQFVHEYGRY